MARKTVCIIGAGPSGLVAAKTLIHNAPGHSFSVTLFDPLPRVGGLWPRRRDEPGGLVHPLMVTNQSRHTVQFSDFAWDPAEAQLPLAWRVGRYLEAYAERYLLGREGVELNLGTRVVKVEKKVASAAESEQGWDVWVKKEQGQGKGGVSEDYVEAETKAEKRQFDAVIVASGFFGKPIIDERFTVNPGVPVVHSSQYRDLNSLFEAGSETRTGTTGTGTTGTGTTGTGTTGTGTTGTGTTTGSKILVVGGQMSGIEIAGTIASHISAAQNSPGPSSLPSTIPDLKVLSVHHLIQRPIWTGSALPFIPLDCGSYNLNNRAFPLVNTQGHITEEAAVGFHGLFKYVAGTDQAEYHPLLQATGNAASDPQFLAVSDTYADFVRAGLITLQRARLASIEDGVAKTTSTVSSSSSSSSSPTLSELPSSLPAGGETVNNVAAVVLATGFDASASLSFLPDSILAQLHHDPTHRDLPLALALHGTHHPDVAGLGFVGFYRSPYWGIMEMQARTLAALWTPDHLAPRPASLDLAISADACVANTLRLRSDPRRSQYPMGDYAFIMNDLAVALGMSLSEAVKDERMPPLAHNGLPLDMLTPARYVSAYADDQARAEVRKNLEETHAAILTALTTHKFIARAVFRSLLGTWRLERDLKSKLASYPSGHFSGTAKFLARDITPDGLQTVAREMGAGKDEDEDDGVTSRYSEYLYVEEGEFRATNGLVVPATRRYVWRYDEALDVLSVWFAKPDDPRRADYLFHEVEFSAPTASPPSPEDAGGNQSEKGADLAWRAGAGHLCAKDFYDVKYRFEFAAINLAEWSVGYNVDGPAKDYTIHGVYRR